MSHEWSGAPTCTTVHVGVGMQLSVLTMELVLIDPKGVFSPSMATPILGFLPAARDNFCLQVHTHLNPTATGI
jgi:hypothetical protein